MRDKIRVGTHPEMGRGIFATRNIVAGETIMVCELLVLNVEDTIKVNETDLKYYTFKYNENQDCLVLGLGEIFNHADFPNTIYRLIDLGPGTRKMMEFVSKKSVKAGDQLFIDYTADTNVNVSNYVTQKSLIG